MVESNRIDSKSAQWPNYKTPGNEPELHEEYDRPVVVDDEGDGFKQNSVLCVGVLDLLGLGGLLGFVEDGLQTLRQAAAQRCVLCNNRQRVLNNSSHYIK